WAIAGRCPGGRPLRRRRESGVDIGEARLRGTAALQACPETDGPLLADALEGVRSVGAVKAALISAKHGCQGPQPSRPGPNPMGHCWPIPWRAPAPSAP